MAKRYEVRSNKDNGVVFDADSIDYEARTSTATHALACEFWPVNPADAAPAVATTSSAKAAPMSPEFVFPVSSALISVAPDVAIGI